MHCEGIDMEHTDRVHSLHSPSSTEFASVGCVQEDSSNNEVGEDDDRAASLALTRRAQESSPGDGSGSMRYENH